MIAVGHISLAYLIGKLSSKLLKVNPNIAVLMVLSILPDIDLAIGTVTGLHIHRGPTHSLIVALVIFAPVFIFYSKRAVPYFLAYISHALIGDFFIGGRLQLFWPLLKNKFGFFASGFPQSGIYNTASIAAEFVLFLVAIIIMAKTGDYQAFFKSNKTNLMLVIPLVTVLWPTFIGYPFAKPLLLTSPILSIANLFLLVLFGLAILTVIYTVIKKRL